MLEIHPARRRNPCAWTSIVSQCCSVSQHSASSIRDSAPSSGSCLSNAETTTSCVPNVGHAVPACRKADLGASATCPSWSTPSCCGGICGVLRAPIAGIAPGKRVRPAGSGHRGRSASPTRDERKACGGVRATHGPVALASPHARCCAGPVRGAVVAARASSAEPLGAMRLPGVRGTATRR